MATAATPQSDYAARGSADQSRFLGRWLKVWVALLAVVVLVVVVYLIAITNSLASINGNLATADDAVTGAGGDVKTLPDQVESVNASLGGIDPALQPITGQADAIVGNLTSINGKLVDVDNSLKDTNGKLVTIDSSLKNTTGVLRAILGETTGIRGLLVSANQPAGPCWNETVPPPITEGPFDCEPAKDGVQNIHQRVSLANGDLNPALGDANRIVASLGNDNAGVVGSLKGICDSLVLSTLGCSS